MMKAAREIIRANVRKYRLPMYYCNTVGSQTEIVFDGGSLIFDAQGNIVKELPYFEEATACSSIWKHCRNPAKAIPSMRLSLNSRSIRESWYSIITFTVFMMRIVLGIKDYFGKMGFKQAILGSSGGIRQRSYPGPGVRSAGRGECASHPDAFPILYRTFRG